MVELQREFSLGSNWMLDLKVVDAWRGKNFS